MSDLVERLRNHVNNRGGPSIENGAWQMMLDAADMIEHLKAVDLARAKLLAGAVTALDEIANATFNSGLTADNTVAWQNARTVLTKVAH